MKINDFQGELTDISAKKAALACTSVKIVRSKQIVLLDTLIREKISSVIEICSIKVN